MLPSGNFLSLFLKVNKVFVIGGCGLYFGPIVVCMHNMLRQIPYHVHVGLQVEVHVNYLIIRDLSSLSYFNLLTGRACSITGREMDFHKFATLFKYREISPTAYIFQRPFLRGLWRG